MSAAGREIDFEEINATIYVDLMYNPSMEAIEDDSFYVLDNETDNDITMLISQDHFKTVLKKVEEYVALANMYEYDDFKREYEEWKKGDRMDEF